MAITTYAELQTAVGNWLHRSDVSTIIPDLIALGEAHLNANIRVPEMEVTTTLQSGVGDRFAAFPAGYQEIESISYQGEELVKRPSSEVAECAAVNSSGLPTLYALTQRVEFDRIPDQDYALTIVVVDKLDIASDSTNWLLTRYPNAYLFATLAEAAPYTKNVQMIPVWTTKRDEAIRSVNRAEGKKRVSVLTTDVNIGSQFNISTRS